MRNSSWKISSSSLAQVHLDRPKPQKGSPHSINDFYLTSLGKLRRQNTLDRRVRAASLAPAPQPVQGSVAGLLRGKPAAYFQQTAALARPLAEVDRCFASLADLTARLSVYRYELSASMKQSVEEAQASLAEIMAACFEEVDGKNTLHQKQQAALQKALAAAEREAAEWRERCRGYERSLEICHLEVDSYRATVEHLRQEIGYLDSHNRQIVAALGREDLPDRREELRTRVEAIKKQSSAMDSMIDRLMGDEARLEFLGSFRGVLGRMQASRVDRATQTPPQLPAISPQPGPGRPGQPAGVLARFVQRQAEEGVHVLPLALVEAAVLELLGFVAREPDCGATMEELLCMFHLHRTANARLAAIHVAQMVASLRCYADSCRCRLLLRLLDHPAVDPQLAVDTWLALLAAAAPPRPVPLAAVRPLLERLAALPADPGALDADQLMLLAVDARLAELASLSAAVKSRLPLDASIDQVKAAVSSLDPRYRSAALDRCLLLALLDRHDLDLDAFLQHLARVRLFAADRPAPVSPARADPRIPADEPRADSPPPRPPERQDDEGRQLLDAASSIFAHHYSVLRSVRQYLAEFGRQAREDLEAKELFRLVADLAAAVESACQFLAYPVHL